MKTGNYTTYIFLERGIEDIGLLNEINKVFSLISSKGIKDTAKSYPLLLELQQGLREEKWIQDNE